MLPELEKNVEHSATIFFRLAPSSSSPPTSTKWFHHWYLPDGQISLSVGKNGSVYSLRFPGLALFQITPAQSKITCYHFDIPADTIRHLLLDQVIPRLLSQQGKQILHASCVKVGKFAVAFSGNSGWGKSTLSAFFHNQGYPLLTDDCLQLHMTKGNVMSIPNYQGIRLLPDTLPLFHKSVNSDTTPKSSPKKRFKTPSTQIQGRTIPIKNIFILKDPASIPQNTQTTITKIIGAKAPIELIKNCFPLDITDKKIIGRQLIDLSRIANSENISIHSLIFPRKINFLPEVMINILKHTST